MRRTTTILTIVTALTATIATAALALAIGIAIHDACGVWMDSWPMTPEKILRKLGKI